jgi:hypothetical protein
MTEADADLPAELRFRSPGWNLYGGALVLAALVGGFTVFVWVAEALATWGGARYRVGIFYQLRGVYVGLACTVVALLFCGLLIYGTASTWRRWRRLRPPATVLDADGVRFEARRRPLAVSWPDVERLVLMRNTYQARLSSEQLSLHLAATSALVREGRPQIPASRRLFVGELRDASAPGEVAVRFLERTAGSRLEVREHELSSR